jgi:hypothetical protein
MEAKNDPYKRLQQYMNIFSGVPQAMNTTQTTSAPVPGIAQQLVGTGLAAAGAYKTFAGT